MTTTEAALRDALAALIDKRVPRGYSKWVRDLATEAFNLALSQPSPASSTAGEDAGAFKREIMDRTRHMMGTLADLREAVDLDDDSASTVLGYCDDLETAVHNIGAVASHLPSLSPSSGEPASVAVEATDQQLRDAVEGALIHHGAGQGPAYVEIDVAALRANLSAPSKPTPVEAGLREALDAPLGEKVCMDCHGHNPVWFAPNEIWNFTIGGPDAKGDPGGFFCPNCFIVRAEKAGVIPSAWKLEPETIIE